MTTVEPSTTPERRLPNAIEQAIEDYADAVWTTAVDEEGEYEDVTEPARLHLHQVILAALEPDRELRARSERLRMKVIDTYADIYASIEFEEAEDLHPGDLADDLNGAET